VSCGAERDILYQYITHNNSLALPLQPDVYGQDVMQLARHNAGIYPESIQTLRSFVEVWKDALHEFGPNDFIVTMCNNGHFTNTIIKHFSRGPRWSPEFGFCGLQSFRWRNPWTSALHGKTVLIIHPFIDSIKCQMRRRQALFRDPNVLPNMTVKYIKTVQSMLNLAPNASWVHSLHWMYSEIDKVGYFDVALIAGGAYAVPLAVYVKRTRAAPAIVLGGASQLLFGLKGQRWDNRPQNQFYLDTWIYPLRIDTPEGRDDIEGCYWGEPAQVPQQCPV